MKTITLSALAISGLLLSSAVFMACYAGEGGAKPEAAGADMPDEAKVPQGMVRIDATDAQPVGISELALKKHFDKVLKSKMKQRKGWENAWSKVFLFSTPAHTVKVPEFWLGKYEVTNAQWKVYFDSEANSLPGLQTNEDLLRLGDMASYFYDVDPSHGAQFQKAWLYVLDLNPHLMEHLNKDGDEKWDPLSAQAFKIELPAGLEIKATRYLPPYGWKGASPTENELGKPVRGVSWQAATDFCEWAGFHLPHEHEFERAVRGDEGRLFPWGDEWDPGLMVWSGFNKVAVATDALEPVGPAGQNPPAPVAVDSSQFEPGCAPGKIFHLLGNVSEWTSGLAYKYGGSKTGFQFANIGHIARGSSYQDVKEVLLGSDRAADGPGGYLSHNIELEAYGFRLAGYPQQGRDLTSVMAARYSAENSRGGPTLWLPTPPKLKKAGDAAKFQGFDVGGTAGRMNTQVATGRVDDHAYVTGPARGIALLPIKGLPPKAVTSEKDIETLADDPEQVFLLGLLVGTPNQKIRLVGPPISEEQPGKEFEISFSDARMMWGGDYPGARKENTGLMLVLRGTEVAVYLANPGDVGNSTKYLKNKAKMLGVLPKPFVGTWEKASKPSCKLVGKDVVMSVMLKTLDKKGNVPKKINGKQVHITISVPVPGLE